MSGEERERKKRVMLADVHQSEVSRWQRRKALGIFCWLESMCAYVADSGQYASECLDVSVQKG